MGGYDIFKHLYDFGAACRPEVLDFRTPVLIDRRTGVRSNARTNIDLERSGGVMVSHGIRRMEPPLRLTRRGRAAVLVVLFVTATLASAVLFTTASRADQAPAGAAPTVVVQPGDTRWGIAARARPGRDGQAAVAELHDLNKLPSYDIQPGDVLVLPRGH
jgi:LysM repeat protein